MRLSSCIWCVYFILPFGIVACWKSNNSGESDDLIDDGHNPSDTSVESDTSSGSPSTESSGPSPTDSAVSVDTATSNVKTIDSDSVQGDPTIGEGHTVYTDAWALDDTALYVSGYTSGQGDNTEGFIKQYDGITWKTLFKDLNGASLQGLWSLDGVQVYVAGTQGAINLRANGEAFFSQTSFFQTDYVNADVWGLSDDEMFVCGYGGHILRGGWQGGWQTQDSGTNKDLHAVLGTASDRVFAAGDNGVILRFDGESWSPMESGTQTNLNAIYAVSDKEVYIAGGTDGGYETDPVAFSGVVLRLDGEIWRQDLDAGADVLLGLCGKSNGDLYAVGAVREDSTHPVVWKKTDENWTRTRYDGVDVFLWGCWCEFQNHCFAYGTDNVFFAL